MKKKLLGCLLAVSVLSLAGCSEVDYGTHMGSSAVSEGDTTRLEFDAMLYDNDGNNYVTFRGNSFNITPNKVKQYGYDSSGSWISWYETSSVVTVDIDGHYIHSCGSTILFKDTRVEIEPLNENIGMLESSSDKEGMQTPSDYAVLDWYKLSYWWYRDTERGQGDDVMILIQSQNGDNIGVVTGESIQWEVAEKLPKTTLITVDGDKQIFLHRCNFTIIDTALFDKMVE